MLSLFSTSSKKAGFRLQYMEVFNWGTFNEKVFRINPNGNNSLLTGVNAYENKHLHTPKKNNIEHLLFTDVSDLIEEARQYVAQTVNTTLSLLYWKIGSRINTEVLKNKRAEYGKQIIGSLATIDRKIGQRVG